MKDLLAERAESIAYLAGVLVGDGYLSKEIFRLTVADWDFAKAFCYALKIAFNTIKTPKLNKQGYWDVNTGNGRKQFEILTEFKPANNLEKKAWLQGFFDSEGSAILTKTNRGDNCFSRKVLFTSSDSGLLIKAKRYLFKIGIDSRIRPQSFGTGHLGTKPMYSLILNSSKKNYKSFLDSVSSNIKRKQKKIEWIIDSYVNNLSESYRKAQKKGAQAKNKKFYNTTFPKLLSIIEKMLQNHDKVTARICYNLPGYWKANHRMKHSEIVNIAKKI